MYSLAKKGMAEFIGTFVLVLFGCGSAAIAGDNLGHLGIAFAFGLSIVAMAYAIGSVSGCHINPAVSLAMLLNGKLDFQSFSVYLIAQVTGAIAAAGTLYAIIASSGTAVTNLGANGFGDGYGLGISMIMAIVVEIILTFVFIYVILGVTSNEGNSAVAGLVIGLTLAFVHILGIALTGTSVNPARSIGPALLLGGTALAQLWVFIIAPLAGSVLAVIAFRTINRSKAQA